MSIVNGRTIVYSRNKQLKSLSYYQTDCATLPSCLSKEIRIEYDRGFHNGKTYGRNFDERLIVKHPTHAYKKGCLHTGLEKTPIPNHYNGDFLLPNGQKTKITIEYSPDREKVAIKII